KQGMRVESLPAMYPQGGEKVLIYNITGREVPEGKLPADAGCIVMNCTSLAALYRYITTGMPLAVRAAFKPTPSIALEQRSVSLGRREDATLAVRGRHDPCVVPRAVPCVEAAVACALLDMMLEEVKSWN
ncbi:MAG: chorismate synthase, partial [Clostridia bacterium]|nr:chorismate synthase [Clostridia bacterium]